MKPNVFMTVLSTEEYVPGVIALFNSLKKSQTTYNLIVLISRTIDQKVLVELQRSGIVTKLIDPIFPKQIINQDHPRWLYTYSKLSIFAQTQYQKIVFLDADTIVLSNIDDLFTKDNMSAVPTGGLFKSKSDIFWVKNGLNSGVIVVEPNSKIYRKLVELEDLHSSDQGILQAFFKDWPEKTTLHLDHSFNILSKFLPQYELEYGYGFDSSQKPINILHFAGKVKPWHKNASSFIDSDALTLWQGMYLSKNFEY